MVAKLILWQTIGVILVALVAWFATDAIAYTAVGFCLGILVSSALCIIIEGSGL